MSEMLYRAFLWLVFCGGLFWILYLYWKAKREMRAAVEELRRRVAGDPEDPKKKVAGGSKGLEGNGELC